MSLDCEECLETFQSGLEGLALQAEVDTRFPSFRCEKCKVSPYSPGPVADGENLIFLAIHPIHFDEKTNTLAPLAFEQLTRNDLSLLRHEYCCDDLPQTVEQLRSGGAADRSIELCVVLQASEIRQIKDANGRVLGVYDTALSDRMSHASLFVRKDYLADKAARQRARMIVHRTFKDRIRQLQEVSVTIPPCRG